MNYFLRNIVLLIFFTLQSLSVITIAQKDEKHDRIECLKSQKVAFLTERVGLTSKEGQAFWPVYNEFSAKMDSLWRLKKENLDKLYGGKKEMTASEKEAAIDLHIKLELDKARLESEYHQRFKKILSIDKVIKLYSAEYEFKKKMLHMIRDGKPSSCEDCDQVPENAGFSKT